LFVFVYPLGFFLVAEKRLEKKMIEFFDFRRLFLCSSFGMNLELGLVIIDAEKAETSTELV